MSRLTKDAIRDVEARAGTKDLELRRLFNEAVMTGGETTLEKVRRRMKKKTLPSKETRRLMREASRACKRLENISRRNWDCRQYDDYTYLLNRYKTVKAVQKKLKEMTRFFKTEYTRVAKILKEMGQPRRKSPKKKPTGCAKQTTKKYTSRKSPPYPANQCCGQKKRGKDGMYVSKPNKNGVCRWIRQKKR